MHDPMTVAHEIKSPFKDKHGYQKPIVTIWHVDPEKDGTDDSCGWFIRARHVNQTILEEIRKEFLFNFKHNYWFDANGYRIFSTSGIILNMFTTTLWIHFKRSRRRLNRFMRSHLHEILHLAENPTDCIGDTITRKFGNEINEEGMRSLAGIIYTWVLRKERPWYKHPRWHIHHWKIQWHWWQNLKRRYWDKCCICGERGFKGAAMGDWDGTRIWHEACDRSSAKPKL